MRADQTATLLSPCYFAASLVGEGQFHPMTVTRIGVDGAQLTGEAPLTAGAQTLLEMNRPTDGERVRVPIRIARIHSEGQQFGWKPSFHVEFLAPLEAVPSLRKTDEVVLESGDSSPFDLPSIDMSFGGSASSSSESSDEIVLLQAPEPPVRPSISVDDVAAEDPDAPGRLLFRPVSSGEGWSTDPEVPIPRREGAWTPWSGNEEPPSGGVDREARILSEVPVTYFHAGADLSGTAQDFSRQGMFLAVMPGDALPRLGDAVRVRFPVPVAAEAEVVGMRAEVRWTHGGDGRSARGRGVGLQIVRFDDDACQDTYERWVTSLLTSP